MHRPLSSIRRVHVIGDIGDLVFHFASGRISLGVRYGSFGDGLLFLHLGGLRSLIADINSRLGRVLVVGGRLRAGHVVLTDSVAMPRCGAGGGFTSFGDAASRLPKAFMAAADPAKQL